MSVPAQPLLVVDDDPVNIDVLTRRLVRLGYPVATASSGREALDYLALRPVSLVLLDVQMPEMNGLDVLREIRQRWSDAELPVLMVTAKSQSEDVVTALTLGASDYITKPIDFPIAIARIRTQLSRKDAEDRLKASEERYALAAQGANDGLWDWDFSTGRLYYSPRWKAIVGHEADEVGDGPDEWFGRVHPDDLPRLHQELEEHLAGRTAHLSSEHRIRHKSGRFRWVLTRGRAVLDGNGRPIRMAGSQSDVTDAKVVDALTGLPNRVLLVDRLERMLHQHRRRNGRRLAVLFMDLDGFKLVNDGMGHLFGDQLLQLVASRLRLGLRSSDDVTRATQEPADGSADHTLARLGGDEFVILLHDVRDVLDAARVAERIQRALAAPFQLGEREVFTTASIGIAVDTDAYTKPEDILRDADTAMYRAKALGKGRSEVFDAAMRDQVVERMHLDTALRAAAERREFVPYFQPIVSLSTGQLAGFEALIRWQRPGVGIVPPSVFIDALHESRLIVPVGGWLFGEVCQRLREWQNAAPSAASLRINVNFAGPQFNEVDLLDRLLGMLQDAGLTPGQLVVEITEATAISDFSRAADILQRIREAGFRIVLDDFGTGYSSLSCLHELPIHGIKLDRSFVSREARHPAILKAVVVLAEQLGLTVTAEGVETEQQAQQLRELGCGFGQGYLFGRPADADTALALIREHARQASAAPAA